MAPIRSSNIERGKWRNKCREQLSKHIGSKLGIVIEPSQVRLIPGPDDPYIWRVLPEKEELFSRIFSKNISDHSIGAYKELCEGVGITFEAVQVTATAKINSAKAQGVTISTLNYPEVSFSAKIDELRTENARLAQELSKLRDETSTEIELRQQAEEEVSRLRNTNQQLQREAQDSAIKYVRGLNSIGLLLEELKTQAPLGGCEVFRQVESPI